MNCVYKGFLIAIAVSMAAISLCGQTSPGKPLPSRDETLAYLDKKVAETKGLTFFIPSEGTNYLVKSISLSAGDGKGIATFTNVTNIRPGTCEENNIWQVVTFKPAQIIAVTETHYIRSDSMGFALVKLSSKGAKLASTPYVYRSKKAIPNSRIYTSANPYCSDFGAVQTTSTTVDTFQIVFLKGDPTNFERVRKALFHLRDLDKAADDDPFK